MNATRALHGLTWRLLAVFSLLVAATKVSGAFYGYVYNGTPGFEVARWFLESSFYDVAFYTPTLLAVIAVNNLVAKDSRRTILTLAIAIALGNVVGFPLSDGIRHALESNPTAASDESARSLAVTITNYAAGWLEGCLWCTAATILYFFVVREGEAAESLHREELDRISLDQQMTEARLQVMQAQIEPHFLFNTLANVRRLYQTEPETGRTMLQHLRRYLSAALPQMREAQSTLGRELALTVAYLNVQKIRMGARLTFEIDAPEALKSISIPPMMLVTLVENAIKHGLAPLPEGGAIRIDARHEHETLRLQVTDSGRGFQKSSGAGVGLANIRARLSTLYGNRARLRLSTVLPSGVAATIELPVASPSDAQAA